MCVTKGTDLTSASQRDMFQGEVKASTAEGRRS